MKVVIDTGKINKWALAHLKALIVAALFVASWFCAKSCNETDHFFSFWYGLLSLIFGAFGVAALWGYVLIIFDLDNKTQ